MRGLELRHLRALLAIAEEGSFTGASRRLHLAQSGLSQQAKDLEEELGLPLLVRERSGVRLTPAGEQAVSLTRRILRDVAALQRIGAPRSEDEAGLRVAATMLAMNDWLPAVVSRMHAIRPNVRLLLKEVKSMYQVDQVRSGLVDAGIAYMPLDLAGVSHRALFDQGMVAVVRADSSWARQKSVRLRDLAHDPLVLYPVEHALRRIVDAEIARLGLQTAVALEANSPSVVTRAVRDGLGVAIVSDGFPRHAPLDGLTTVRLQDRRLRRRIVLLWPQRRYPTGAPLLDFIDCVCCLAETWRPFGGVAGAPCASGQPFTA